MVKHLFRTAGVALLAVATITCRGKSISEPLDTQKVAPLVGTTWRLVHITYQGTSVAVGPGAPYIFEMQRLMGQTVIANVEANGQHCIGSGFVVAEDLFDIQLSCTNFADDPAAFILAKVLDRAWNCAVFADSDGHSQLEVFIVCYTEECQEHLSFVEDSRIPEPRASRLPISRSERP